MILDSRKEQIQEDFRQARILSLLYLHNKGFSDRLYEFFDRKLLELEAACPRIYSLFVRLSSLGSVL
jgi:hypothetical protein